ncbi:hypothetical protein FHS63_002721 [Azospirillum doebereinerae]
MTTLVTVGLDPAKNVFQVHGVTAEGKVLVRRQLRRGEMLKFLQGVPSCRVGIEACGTAHHWAREIAALGHTVKLMPPAYVKPYVKRGKTDAADAEAIREAVTRPTMRFVAIKTTDQQAALMLHKTRDLLVRQRTMLVNGLRGHLAEFGIIAAKGLGGVKTIVEALHEAQDQLPSWRGWRCTGSSSNFATSAPRSNDWRSASWFGIGPAMSADGWLPLPASVRSPRVRSRRPCRTEACSDPAASSPRGLA